MAETAIGTREASDTERSLIEAAQKNPRDFAPLYESNFERVYAYIARRVQNRETAEDLTSQVFQNALAKLPGFEWRGAPFAAWLFRIAANAIIDHAHRAKRERDLPQGDCPDQLAMEDSEHRARLFRIVDTLPEDQRRTIIMRFAQQKSLREVSRELKRSEGAIKQLQFRALKNLRARLGHQDE